MTSYVHTPELLELSWPGEGPFFGCDQDWFRSFWQRKAGCGSCTGANILNYLSRRSRLKLPHAVLDRDSFIKLMEYSWQYLTPGVMGLNSPFLMQKGLDEMLATLGYPGKSQVLEIPAQAENRPRIAEVEQFIRAGLHLDSPVAFLNLHNGGQTQLETWHWVTVVGLHGSGQTAELDIFDNGTRLRVRLLDWLKHTRRGGGFVYVEGE